MKYNRLITKIFISSIIFSTIFLVTESAFAENSTELSTESISKKIAEIQLQQQQNSQKNSNTPVKLDELSQQIQKLETELSSKNELALVTEQTQVKNKKIIPTHLASYPDNFSDLFIDKKEQLATLLIKKDELKEISFDLTNEEKSLFEQQEIYEQQLELATKNQEQSNTKKTIVTKAQEELGKPYVYGANGPDSFDCSGLVQYVFSEVGRTIGRTTVEQELAGKTISIEEAQEGDLLFWGNQGNSYHVAISLGNGSYIHAPVPGAVVEISSITTFTPSFGIRVTS